MRVLQRVPAARPAPGRPLVGTPRSRRRDNAPDARVGASRAELTWRGRQLLILLAGNKDNKTITTTTAVRLSDKTVRNNLSDLYDKLQRPLPRRSGAGNLARIADLGGAARRSRRRVPSAEAKQIAASDNCPGFRRARSADPPTRQGWAPGGVAARNQQSSNLDELFEFVRIHIPPGQPGRTPCTAGLRPARSSLAYRRLARIHLASLFLRDRARATTAILDTNDRPCCATRPGLNSYCRLGARPPALERPLSEGS